MVQRVIIGSRGSDVGLWVSKPGKSASSTDPSDFLIDTAHEMLRPIRGGIITNPTLPMDGSSHAPTKGYSGGYWFTNDTDKAGHSLLNYSAIWRNNEGSYSNDGFALYTKKYFYNSNHSSLGYRPFVHISIGSGSTGDAYPRIFIDDTGITLSHQETWECAAQRASRDEQTYYPQSYQLYGFWFFSGSYEKKSLQKNYWYQNAPKNGSFQTNCTIHYTVYQRAW